jgi:5-(carboxyamino)imidazole ribonucleotide mutase
MLASVTPLPVIGVPVPLKYLDCMDSLLSTVRTPAGAPVATVSIGGTRNADLLAARTLALEPAPSSDAAGAHGGVPGGAEQGCKRQGRGSPAPPSGEVLAALR